MSDFGELPIIHVAFGLEAAFLPGCDMPRSFFSFTIAVCWKYVQGPSGRSSAAALGIALREDGQIVPRGQLPQRSPPRRPSVPSACSRMANANCL